MKILITGGTGFLGLRLTKKLIKESHDVTVCSRHSSEDLKKAGSKKITCDVCDKEAIDNALKKIDIVYHLAANLDESDPDMEKTNIKATKNIIESCKKKQHQTPHIHKLDRRPRIHKKSIDRRHAIQPNDPLRKKQDGMRAANN